MPETRIFPLTGLCELWDDDRVYFELLGQITHIKTFAVGSRIREVARLRKLYGKGRWRKRKEYKIKRLL
jgi:hypothetical protein